MAVLKQMEEWYRDNVAKPQEQSRQERELRRQKMATAEKSPATSDELAAIAAISPMRVTFSPGTWCKKFAKDIQGHTELSGRQRVVLWDLVYTYRRQIPDMRLVKMAKEIIDQIAR